MSGSKRVGFTAMKEGTAEDFKIIAANDRETAGELPERLIEHLREMAHDDGAYRISRLDHVLQCATRAYRDGAEEDWVIAALFHDIGDVLAPFTHGQVAAEIIRPFVKEEVAWVVRNHGTFQMHYNKSLSEEERRSRDKFKDHPYYQLAVDFCEKWDQNSFDPAYPTERLEFFIPLIKKVFGRQPFSS
ncbi:HD domain-containing protein [Leptobacterium flavescens]|uniref:HD domain-containing protein n=1 Tax=Leptobacterium flavescens TaxID=472055 RepID=A0A6P0USN6_9FLAO|nr:HD domain-containing protein [Leptobacterium flavescens]NER14998.1 HD domain-containing protein [Leptobacterium flavescens]